MDKLYNIILILDCECICWRIMRMILNVCKHIGFWNLVSTNLWCLSNLVGTIIVMLKNSIIYHEWALGRLVSSSSHFKAKNVGPLFVGTDALIVKCKTLSRYSRSRILVCHSPNLVGHVGTTKESISWDQYLPFLRSANPSTYGG